MEFYGVLWGIVLNPKMTKIRPCSHGSYSCQFFWGCVSSWTQSELVCGGEEGFVTSSVFFLLLGFPEAGGGGVMGWEGEPRPRAGRGRGQRETSDVGMFASPGQEGAHSLACCFLYCLLLWVRWRANPRDSLMWFPLLLEKNLPLFSFFSICSNLLCFLGIFFVSFYFELILDL